MNPKPSRHLKRSIAVRLLRPIWHLDFHDKSLLRHRPGSPQEICCSAPASNPSPPSRPPVKFPRETGEFAQLSTDSAARRAIGFDAPCLLGLSMGNFEPKRSAFEAPMRSWFGESLILAKPPVWAVVADRRLRWKVIRSNWRRGRARCHRWNCIIICSITLRRSHTPRRSFENRFVRIYICSEAVRDKREGEKLTTRSRGSSRPTA